MGNKVERKEEGWRMKERMIDYKVRYRRVRYPRLEFRTGKLMLILPYGTSPEPIIEKHRRWIDKKSAFIQECIKDAKNKKLIERSDDAFKKLVQKYVQNISEELNVRSNKIIFRKMKTKWASCSSEKNLTINTLMKFLPETLIEYIIFHELTHLIERYHNKRFWKIIEERFKNYQKFEKLLFTYWFLIFQRGPAGSVL